MKIVYLNEQPEDEYEKDRLEAVRKMIRERNKKQREKLKKEAEKKGLK